MRSDILTTEKKLAKYVYFNPEVVANSHQTHRKKKPLISVFMSRGGGVWAGRKERGSGEECQPIKIHT